jgi:hypothetical protein
MKAAEKVERKRRITIARIIRPIQQRRSRLQPRSRRLDDDPRKTQFTTAEIPPIKCHNRRIAHRNGQLQHMIVTFVWQVRSPTVIHLNEPRPGQKSIEQLGLLRRG